jgi:hypothetical protein
MHDDVLVPHHSPLPYCHHLFSCLSSTTVINLTADLCRSIRDTTSAVIGGVNTVLDCVSRWFKMGLSEPEIRLFIFLSKTEPPLYSDDYCGCSAFPPFSVHSALSTFIHSHSLSATRRPPHLRCHLISINPSTHLSSPPPLIHSGTAPLYPPPCNGVL